MRTPLGILMAVLLIAPLILYPLFPDASYTIGIDNFLGVGDFRFEVSSRQLLFMFSYVMAFAVAAQGLNVQTGFAGQLNLGFAGFMAIGGYSAALLQHHYREDFVANPVMGILLSILVSGVASAVIGLLVCLPTMRLRGDYFAIVTFGFAEIVRQTMKNEPWTMGANGIRNIRLLPNEKMTAIDNRFFSWVDGQGFSIDYWVKYLFFLVILAVTLWAVTCLRDSSFGRALFALRENEKAAETCGISLAKAKVLAFIIAAFIAGVAGYMMVVRNGTAHPNGFIFMVSIYVLCGVILGGMGSVRGTLLGALVLMSLGEFLRDLLSAMPKGEDGLPIVPPETRIILFGLVLVLMMRFRPNGLISLESDTIRLSKKVDVDKLREDGTPSPYYKVGDRS